MRPTRWKAKKKKFLLLGKIKIKLKMSRKKNKSDANFHHGRIREMDYIHYVWKFRQEKRSLKNRNLIGVRCLTEKMKK